jgi:hypothetical protein
MGYQKSFAKIEYCDHVAAVKVRMQQAGFDSIICQDPAIAVKQKRLSEGKPSRLFDWAQFSTRLG